MLINGTNASIYADGEKIMDIKNCTAIINPNTIKEPWYVKIIKEQEKMQMKSANGFYYERDECK